MRALVLGGNGFIGSHLVDNLLAAGHSVCVFDREAERHRPPLGNVQYSFGSFADTDKIRAELDGVDVVFHLICTTLPSSSNDDPVADVEGNVISTLRLLELLVEKDVPKLVFLSSGGTVYGVPDTIPVTERMAKRPICSYGISKLTIERYLYMFHSLYGLKYAALRVSNPYGERQGHIGVQGVIGTFIDRVLCNKSVEVWGDGSIERDYIYVRDVAEACRNAAESRANGMFNIGSGEANSVGDIIAALAVASGRQIVPVYKSGRSFDVPRNVLDCSKATETFGWRATTGLTEGIARTWTWAEQQARKSDT